VAVGLLPKLFTDVVHNILHIHRTASFPREIQRNNEAFALVHRFWRGIFMQGFSSVFDDDCFRDLLKIETVHDNVYSQTNWYGIFNTNSMKAGSVDTRRFGNPQEANEH
jgi:hypothetical protein